MTKKTSIIFGIALVSLAFLIAAFVSLPILYYAALILAVISIAKAAKYQRLDSTDKYVKFAKSLGIIVAIVSIVFIIVAIIMGAALTTLAVAIL